MLLEQVNHFNDLSPKLREELTEKIKSFGKTVRYKFNIANRNPDPTKHNGEFIWPRIYTLDPTVFNITDPYEDRKDKQKLKRIALVDGVDDNGRPNRFRKVRVEERYIGEIRLNLEENPDDFYIAMFLELHPKHEGGKFAVSSMQKVFKRIDEKAHAKEGRDNRKVKKLAMDAAYKMSDEEIVEFADAMSGDSSWNSSLDIDVLRDKVEALAETSPSLFNDIVGSKRLAVQAAIKRAINKNIWTHDPAEGKLSWTSTGQPIVMIGVSQDGKPDLERFGEWFLTAGDTADKTYKKLLSLEKGEKVTENS